MRSQKMFYCTLTRIDAKLRFAFIIFKYWKTEREDLIKNLLKIAEFKPK